MQSSQEENKDASLPQPALQVTLENGFALLPPGEWLCSNLQPTASKGTASVKGLKGWFVADRPYLRSLTSSGQCWFSDQKRPFLTRLDAMPDRPLSVVSSKLLVAPAASRRGAANLRLIPLNFRSTLTYSTFQDNWVVVATASRCTRISIDEGETLSVRPEALVAWYGQKPTGFCPRLSVWDMLLPRLPSQLTFSFHGPAILWLEGSTPAARSGQGKYPQRIF